MKFSLVASLFLSVLAASAQFVSIVAPALDSQVIRGVPFTVSLTFESTTSSAELVALRYGIELLNATGPNDDTLGDRLGLETPKFSDFSVPGPNGRFLHNFNVTISASLEFTGTATITVGEFYTIGALATPETHTTKVLVNVQ